VRAFGAGSRTKRVREGQRLGRDFDTNWKRLTAPIEDSISPSDIYQMMAYARIYEVKHLMLLYPHHTELVRDEGVIANYLIAGTDATQLGIRTISLADLGRFSSRLKSFVARFEIMPDIAAA
jgi:5-methylcytosine-specific restriction enzyme subunit McrC